jgi:hypothetical protein
MRSAIAALALASATALLAPAAFAGDDDGKPLKLLPAAKKGLEMEIEAEGTVEKTNTAGGVVGDSVKATLKRKVRSIDDDGLPSREALTVEKADIQHFEYSRNGSSSRSSTGLGGQVLTFLVERTGAGRRAVPEGGGKFPANGMPDNLLDELRRDPDGIAFLVQTDEAMAPGDEWNVNREELLDAMGPAKAKLAKKGSRAVATLESLDKKDGKVEARISIKATLNFSVGSGDDEQKDQQIKVRATLEGPIDGSGPPRVQEIVVTRRFEDETKETRKLKLVTTLKSPEPDKDKDKAKDDKDSKDKDKSKDKDDDDTDPAPKKKKKPPEKKPEKPAPKDDDDE